MERFLIKAAVFLSSAAAALALTSLILGSDFELKISGLITATLTSGLTIHGLGTWIAATVLVWLVTAIATWVLPLIFLHNKAEERKG